MAIVGFNFTKILAEKNSGAKGKIDIKNNVSVTNVESADLALGETKGRALKFSFDFKSEYTPAIGNIAFTADLMYMNDGPKLDEIMKAWKKNKQVPKEIMHEVLNTVLMRCNVEALMLSRDVNLPPPVPMPKLKK